MAVDENMLLSDMATETRRTQRAMQQRARDTKRSAAAKGAGKSIDLEDAMTRREKMESVGKEAASKVRQKVQATPVKSTSKVTPTNDPSTMSRSSRRMMSGLLENAPKNQTSTPIEPFIGPRRGRMRPVGEKATSVGTFTKSSEPTPTKTMPNMTTGSRGDIAARGKAAAMKSGALRPDAGMAAKGAGTIAAIEAAGPVMAAVSALAEADKATNYKRTQYSGNFGGPSFSTNPYASSSKPAYSGQSTMSKLMGVGKKGK